MTETERTALLSACSFAKVFIESADAELRTTGLAECYQEPLRKFRKRSAKQLQAALRIIEDD
jgi:hypothetical protein